MEIGESFLETAKRELEEETELIAKTIQVIEVLSGQEL
jgi:ADP-ribose pyrophosphatase YjhB (NUDIX family)